MELNLFRPWFSMSRITVFIFAALILVILFNFGTFFYLNSPDNHNQVPLQSLHNQKTINQYTNYDLTKIDVNDLDSRVRELLSIRSSVLKELRQLERNRTLVIQQLNDKNNELEKLKLHITKKSTDLDRLQLHIKQAEVAQKEAKDRVDSLIEPPLNLLPKQAQEHVLIVNKSPITDYKYHQSLASTDQSCQMHNCFDYSRCSLFSPFYVYIYNLDANFNLKSANSQPQSEFNSMLLDQFQASIHVTSNSKIACVYLVLIFEDFVYLNNSVQFENYLYALPHWGGDGRNNIVVNLNSNLDLHQIGVDVMKAILVQTRFTSSDLRTKFDLVLPNIQFIHNISAYINDFSPNLSPARRKYFISYLGFIENKSINANSNLLNLQIKKVLLNLFSKHNSAIHNEFLFDFDCDEKTKRLCDNQTIILLDSTFTLIMPPISQTQIVDGQENIVSATLYNNELNSRLFNALAIGSIPVLIGGDFVSLPFAEAIDWNRAVVRIPIARITELYVVLKTFSDADLIEIRRFGNYIFRNYFSSLNLITSSLLAFIRNIRLQIPSPPIPNESSNFYFNQPKYDISNLNQSDQISNSLYASNNQLSDRDENLGPNETPFPSQSYRRNFSMTLSHSYALWNEIGHSPFYVFPSLPIDPVLPSEAKFIGSSYGFRPIAGGVGGSGREFSEAIGGNYIREQFTIIILTYERETILLDALQRLRDLPYLNKVVVVWNSPRPPLPEIKWPDIGVDIVVIKAKRNSLNNRFLPYDEIKTDAILSMDDDTNLRHDEIIFAFRVWREARNRIVGFPARYHAWDADHSSWLYDANYTCEFSMILTGAAFFHKHYSYMYTNLMPASIRDKVDELMNCEDIAMNFLVSHISNQPPIKVTSRWTFRCPDCASSLSEDYSHFQERHHCLNYFVSVYGYMPLLYTQFRADSVLFKNRIPHDKQKCFKFI